MAGRFSFTIEATIGNIPVIADGIEDYLTSAGVDPAIIPDIQLAVDEAVTNTVMHGYRGQAGTVTITCSIHDGCVRIVIRDRAPAFNPLTIRDPDISPDLADRAPGGLGFFLVRKVMDAVSYEYWDGENVLTLEKKVPG